MTHIIMSGPIKPLMKRAAALLGMALQTALQMSHPWELQNIGSVKLFLEVDVMRTAERLKQKRK